MIEHIKNGWVNLESVGFYPWVSIIALGVYFIMRAIAGKEKWQAISFVAGGIAVAQASMMFPEKAPEISGNLNIAFALVSWLLGLAMWTLLQLVVSVGLYSFAEAFGLVDILGKAARNAIDKVTKDKDGGSGGGPGQTPVPVG